MIPESGNVNEEPIKPVRIYYSIPDKPFIIRVFNGLRCVGLEAGGRAWDWLYQNEATALTFSAPYEDVPAEIDPSFFGASSFQKKLGWCLKYGRSRERARQPSSSDQYSAPKWLLVAFA